MSTTKQHLCDVVCVDEKLGLMLKLMGTVSDRCSEIGLRCNELAPVVDPLMLKALAAARMHLATMSKLRLRTVNCALRVMFWMVETMSTRYSNIGPRYNEQTQHCELLVLRALAAVRIDLTTTKRLGW